MLGTFFIINSGSVNPLGGLVVVVLKLLNLKYEDLIPYSPKISLLFIQKRQEKCPVHVWLLY